MPADGASLAGKVILVTGAGRGIGLATAQHLAACGAAVAINDLDAALAEAAADSVTAGGGHALAVPGSVADWDLAAAMVEQAVRHFGRLDGLLNNAGLHYQALPWEEEPARVKATVDVNVTGSINCAIHAARQMRAQGSGAILNVASGAVLGAPQRAVYGATKGAMITFTCNLAGDLEPFGIRVNALAPLAATRMTDPRLETSDLGAREGEFAALPHPAAMAPVAAWLLSDAATGVTGKIVRFNGRQLSLISPPRAQQDAIEQDQWTATALDEALTRITSA